MRQSSIAVLIVAGLVVVACQEKADTGTGPSQVNVTVSNTNTNTQGGGTPAPGATPAPGTCPAISQVNVNGPSSVAVGAEGDLDATPKPARSDLCNDASPITWSASPSARCQIVGPTTTYTPNVRCSAAGSCTVAASVFDAVASGLFVSGSLVLTCS